jgi:hypothetical protein
MKSEFSELLFAGGKPIIPSAKAVIVMTGSKQAFFLEQPSSIDLLAILVLGLIAGMWFNLAVVHRFGRQRV